MDKIEFKQLGVGDPTMGEKRGSVVAVLRDGRQVAVLPEADRLRRAMALSVADVEDTVRNFPTIMGREPTRDEAEFWKALLDYKRSESQQNTLEKARANSRCR